MNVELNNITHGKDTNKQTGTRKNDQLARPRTAGTTQGAYTDHVRLRYREPGIGQGRYAESHRNS